ncbi:MAG: methyltransferase domain-containing protein [Anaerolineaceae bacterium]|jgi:2-polyprenyl-3-methyl-5-hydroxy-6-metoxy-1,4-benzoquinol methylase|nr:methyltransferase domain-containing protein [Anaerolineaceae bacterium]
MYNTFSEDYDRFVNWDSRLAYEMPFIEKQINLLQGSKNRPLDILDSACGTGMHAIQLASAGHQVSAADLFPQMIAKARQNASNAGVPVNFQTAGLGNMAETFGTAQFDLLLCLGNSLPHLITAQELLETLQDFTDVLRPGGMLFIQNRNFDAVMQRQERWMEPQLYQEGGAEWIFQRFYDFLPNGLIRFNIATLHHKLDSDWQSGVTSTILRPQMSAELEQQLQQVGFEEIRTFGSMQGEAFSPASSGNLIITAIKP